MGRHAGGNPPHYTFPKANFLVAATLLLAPHIPSTTAIVYPSNHPRYTFNHLSNHAGTHHARRSLSKRDNPIPLIVTNTCGDTIWPGIATQHGDAPELQGFALAPGETKNMSVGPDWQGRVWGRTNCTTSGDSASCMTGDCMGKLNCEYGVSDDALCRPPGAQCGTYLYILAVGTWLTHSTGQGPSNTGRI